MKRKLIFILASLLTIGALKAQQPTHYPFNYHDFPNTMTAIIQIQIDGVEQTSNELELGAFNGDMIVGAERIGCYGSNHYYRVYLTVYGSSGSYDVTFKLYNHQTEEELDNYFITYQGEPFAFTWISDEGLGSNKNPIVLNFVATQTFEKPITAYTPGTKDHYYLIASPIRTVSPENVTNMLSNTYDLYYFDQSQDKEWINYKGDQTLEQEGHFNLEPGKGYLYANSNNVTLTFTGTPYNENGQVDLAYDANAVLKGWNLIGNPFGAETTLDKPYYRLNREGSALKTETENTPIATMEGVFVQATAIGEKANFTAVRRGERTNVAKLDIVVTRGRGEVEDNAIVRFDGGATLGKFQLNPSHTKVYIPQEGKDYAIVRSATQGELPLNFKAEQNGSYTLSFSIENVDFDELHLFDNMTGAEVDLLAPVIARNGAIQEPASYTFEARTTDYASRFRLVFSAIGANGDTGKPNFAFFNGSEWVVDAGDDATLEVIDMMGRVLRRGVACNVSTNGLAQGFYVFRLTNSDGVKVQKVVVR